jgi:type IV pilus assembly protein PilQ
MKKGFFLSFLTSLLFISLSASGAELKAISFSQKGEVSELELLVDANDIKASKFQIKEDKQIIVDLENTIAIDKVLKSFDPSEFSGAIVFIKAYKKPKSEKDIRIAIQLRDNVRSLLVKRPNKIVLQVENRFGVFSQNKVEENQSYKEKVANTPATDVLKINIPKSDSIEDILENIILSGRKKYIGRKISLNLKNIKPEDVLKMIAETSGFNIVMADDVKKLESISLNMNDVPWDQALDTVLDMSKLIARKNGMILIVQTHEMFTRELENLKKAKEATKEQEPLVTKVFPISFANSDDLTKILSEYSTEKKGKIAKDVRTNSLIVKDTAEVIDRMKKIVELLDTQTPQVLIESKIVEISERYSKSIGLDNGFNWGYDPFSTPSASSNAGSFSFSTASTAGGSNLFGLSITKFNRLTGLDFKLSLMESEAKGKIISSPKIVTKNNVAASITQEEVLQYQDTIAPTTTTTGTSQSGATFKAQSANISLKVTPLVTNDGSISMDLAIQKDSFLPSTALGAARDIVKRTITTQVLVDNGSTIVLGGIYSYTHDENHQGIPFLKDIPLVGWLFRTKYNPSTSKKELIIFITPRIINQEEAGLVDRG